MPQSQSNGKRESEDGDFRTRSTYWFQDGNIILQAENTLFRVHQSILTNHSQIFQDTFAMPQGQSQQNESIEGCTVIQLSDTAEDMTNLISMLYDSDKMLSFGDKLPTRFLGPMLRLGRKYAIAHLEKDALERLHHDYPTTLQGWDSREACRRIEYDPDAPFDTTIISIAHEFNLFTIMPAAYAQYHQSEFLITLPNNIKIPKKAREHCIIGHAAIQEYVKRCCVDALCPPMVLPSKGCNGKCWTNIWKIIRELPVWVTDESASFGILESLDLPSEAKKLCPQCQSAVKALTDKVRSEFWSLLPTFFGLLSWSDLKDEF